MSLACVVPEGASPPPEPPPRDYESSSTAPKDLGDDKIRARIEACKQGMMQLDALRSKHHRLMQDMRGRLPPIPGCVDVQARIKRVTENKLDRSSLQSVDSGLSSTQTVPSRCSSPSISHRSSVSCDSGCSSVYSTEIVSTQPAMPYSTYRKLSLEDRGMTNTVRGVRDYSYPSPLTPTPLPQLPIVATTIASTTCLRSEGVTRNWQKKQKQQRPRSMFEKSTQEDCESLVDSVSFSQITPPPVHRKFGLVHVNQSSEPRSPLTPIRVAVNSSPQSPHRPLRTAQRPEVVVKAKAARVESEDVVFHASCIFVDRSPPAERRDVRKEERRVRPQSLFEAREDEPLYATPARVLFRDRVVPTFPSCASRRTAFTPVVSRMVPSQGERPRAPASREWRESEGL